MYFISSWEFLSFVDLFTLLHWGVQVEPLCIYANKCTQNIWGYKSIEYIEYNGMEQGTYWSEIFYVDVPPNNLLSCISVQIDG